MQESIPVGAAEGRPLGQGSSTSTGGSGGALDDPRALQILSTEHWSLLAGRSLAYNEAFSRAGMFLTFLSATLIVIGFVIGFVIGSQGLVPGVVPVAAILLLADLYIGAATVGRLIDANSEELRAVRGVNRIRHAYRKMVPGLEPYFVSSFHDDERGVLAAYGDITPSQGMLANIVHGLTTMIGMVATVVAMIVGALAALVAVGVGLGAEVALLSAVVGFLVGTAIFAYVGMRTAIDSQARVESRFPTPD
jgi:hypothetical protein